MLKVSVNIFKHILPAFQLFILHLICRKVQLKALHGKMMPWIQSDDEIRQDVGIAE